MITPYEVARLLALRCDQEPWELHLLMPPRLLSLGHVHPDRAPQLGWVKGGVPAVAHSNLMALL